MVRVSPPETPEVKIVNPDKGDILEKRFRNLRLNEDDKKLIERAPTRNKDVKKFLDKPYSLEDQTNTKIISIPHTCVGNVQWWKPSIQVAFNDDQILTVANTDAFKQFIEECCSNTAVPAKPIPPIRRESNDSSYFSDSPSPESPEGSTTTTDSQIVKDPEKKVHVKKPKEKKGGERPAQEKLKTQMKQKQKMEKWIEVNLLTDEELFDLDEQGRSVLHTPLLDDKELFPKESFYTFLESMLQRLEDPTKSSVLTEKFQSLIEKEPKIEDILKERHKDLVDYFQEVLENIS